MFFSTKYLLNVTKIFILLVSLLCLQESGTLAAENPFSDVPREHWAYEALAKLSSSGIIDGYEDETFRGRNAITRYEMAQMIAKILAKSDIKPQNKALLEKLKAEFTDELKNLGLRIDELEKHDDALTFTGEVRYNYYHTKDFEGKLDISGFQFCLRPDARLSDNWHLKGEMQALFSPQEDTASPKLSLKHAYAEGTYDNTIIRLGKMPAFSSADNGLVLNSSLSGISLTTGTKLLLTMQGGRLNSYQDNKLEEFTLLEIPNAEDSVVNYFGLDMRYVTSKGYAGLGFHQFNGDCLKEMTDSLLNRNDSSRACSILSTGINYMLDDIWGVYGIVGKTLHGDVSIGDTVWDLGLWYKGCDYTQKGSFEAYIDYSQTGSIASWYSTYSTMNNQYAWCRGWEIGVAYVPLTNFLTGVSYYWGAYTEDIPESKFVSSLHVYAKIFF